MKILGTRPIATLAPNVTSQCRRPKIESFALLLLLPVHGFEGVGDGHELFVLHTLVLTYK